MKVSDFLAVVDEHDGAWSCPGGVPGEVTGWAHYEDAEPGDIAWFRGMQYLPFHGSVLIGKPSSRMLHSARRPTPLRDGQLMIAHPSPRDLIAHLLSLRCWRRAPRGAPAHGLEPQDYRWHDGRWESLCGVGGVRIGEDVYIGNGTHVAPGTLGYTTIGDGCRIGHNCNIGHDARIGRDTLVIAHAKIAGWARVGGRCKIYMGAMIKNGVTIGDGATVGMGAVVIRDVPAGETWAGNPAMRVK